MIIRETVSDDQGCDVILRLWHSQVTTFPTVRSTWPETVTVSTQM